MWQDYWRYEFEVWARAWQRTCDIWSFKLRHIPVYLFSAGGGLLALWWWRGSAAMTEELSVALALICGAVFFFLVTLAQQIMIGPYRLYRLERETTDDLRKQIQIFQTPAIESFEAIAEDSIDTIPRVLNAPRIQAKYIKVGVRALSPTVENCTPYLKSITRQAADGSVTDAPFKDPIPLRWSSHGSSTIDLQAALPRYFDVLHCNEKSNVLDLCDGVSRPVKLLGFFKEPAIYFLRIVVVSTQATAHPDIEVGVDWAGSWETVTAQLRKCVDT